MVRFIQLVYFTEIAERGSFSAAAKSLYVSQSALSQSVAALEAELGAALIHRSRSGVRLTYFGHRVYEEARALVGGFRRFERVMDALRAERGSIGGKVRVQCTPGVEEYLSETVVPELSAAYPGVELIISAVTDLRSGGIQGFLNSGCALGMGACLSEAWEGVQAQAGAAGLVCVFFGSERPQVLLSARSPLSERGALRREDLARLKPVCYSSNPAPRYLSLFSGPARHASNKESIVHLVANAADADYAGVFTPSGIRRELSELRGKVHLLPLDFQDAAIQPVVHYLIHAPEDALQRAEQCVLELVLRFPYTE